MTADEISDMFDGLPRAIRAAMATPDGTSGDFSAGLQSGVVVCFGRAQWNRGDWLTLYGARLEYSTDAEGWDVSKFKNGLEVRLSAIVWVARGDD